MFLFSQSTFQHFDFLICHLSYMLYLHVNSLSFTHEQSQIPLYCSLFLFTLSRYFIILISINSPFWTTKTTQTVSSHNNIQFWGSDGWSLNGLVSTNTVPTAETCHSHTMNNKNTLQFLFPSEFLYTPKRPCNQIPSQ